MTEQRCDSPLLEPTVDPYYTVIRPGMPWADIVVHYQGALKACNRDKQGAKNED